MTQEALEQPVIEILGLTKVFRDFWMRQRVTALQGLDLAVRPHEVYGLLGPNGSGKSTTIKIVLGLLFPTRGRVAVLGRLPTDVATKKRIGYLPEETYLYRFLNARETLDYYGRIFGLDHRTRAKRIDMLLDMVGLKAVQRRPVGEYSKGMQRRIGLAQALINDPDLLILDEPTSGLDPVGTRQIKDLILELRRRGKTVLLSSHLLADVEDVCDRVGILYGGRKRAEGTVDSLLRVSDTTVVETDTLRPQTIAKIEQLIQAEEGKAIRRVEAPRQKLESLFLSIVEQAQAEGLTTSGAASGGPVAEFLAASTTGQALIEQLASTPAAPEATQVALPSENLSEAGIRAAQVIGGLLRGPSENDESGATTPADGPGRPGAGEPDRNVLDELTGRGG